MSVEREVYAVQFYSVAYLYTVEPPHSGHSILSFIERLSSFGGYFVWSVYTRVLLVCPLFRGLSSFGASFIGGFTAHPL